MPRSKTHESARNPATATIPQVLRKIDAVMRRVKRADAAAALSESSRRLEIIDAEYLRRQVRQASALRKEEPALWQALEKSRLERNRENALLSRRLRAEGLRPVELEPSLMQRVKKLKRIEERE